MFQEITPQKAFDLIKKNVDNTNFIILDFRTSNEFSTGHLKNAINLDCYSDDFRKNLDKLDKSNIYLIYCRSGYRSGLAFNKMKKRKFKEVYEMKGTIAWMNAGFSLVK